MCGIVGLIARHDRGFWAKDLDMFEQMLVINTIRGQDATGVFTTYRNKQAEVIKIGTHPFNLFRCKAWSDYRSRVVGRGKVVVGHNRAATRGEKSTQNAHPFVENNIILVHNGTLFNHTNLTKEAVEVDSHAIAHALANEPDIAKVIPEIRGAFALVWYDTDKEKLFAIRNDDRPLSLLETANHYVLSSEPMIAALPLTKANEKITNIIDIEPGELYEFSMNGKYTTTKIDLKKGTPFVRTYTGANTKGGTADSAYSNATRDSINQRTYGGRYYPDCVMTEAELEDDAPFDTGTPSPTEVPQAIQDLRAALAKKATDKRETKSSTACVLTQTGAGIKGKSTSTQPDGLGLSLRMVTASSADISAENNTRSLQVQHPTLVKGRIVLIKPLEVIKRPNGLIGYTGKLHQPGEDLIDVIGYYPDTFTEQELNKNWRSKPCVATVMYVTDSAGGLSVFCSNIHKATLTQTWGNSATPMVLWDYALKECKCNRCGLPANPWDKSFTSVSSVSKIERGHAMPHNRAGLMCADCVEKILKDEVLDEFRKGREQVKESIAVANKLEKARDDRRAQHNQAIARSQTSTPGSHLAVPGGKSLSPSTGGGSDGATQVSGPTTLQ